MSCQQHDCYVAEREVLAELQSASALLGNQHLCEAGRDIPAADLQRWVDQLRESGWWQDKFPQVVKIEAYVRARSDGGSVGSWKEALGAGIIEMSPSHLTPLIVCHEVAHVLAGARYGSKSHDPWWARTYLELVYLTLGHHTYTLLFAAFTAHGIDHEVTT